ncbi:MAG: DUF1778 domain-containing protein [Proteobacteria bacterium]|nr:DUF1778 domain-containing protein [Pseudomonadota bacterium]
MRAEEAMAMRRNFGLDAEEWDAFMAALDAPTRELPRTGKLLTTPSVFEARTAE